MRLVKLISLLKFIARSDGADLHADVVVLLRNGRVVPIGEIQVDRSERVCFASAAQDVAPHREKLPVQILLMEADPNESRNDI